MTRRNTFPIFGLEDTIIPIYFIALRTLSSTVTYLDG